MGYGVLSDAECRKASLDKLSARLVEDEVDGRFTFPVRLRQRFALRAIVHYEADEQQWLNQVRRETLTFKAVIVAVFS